jgi:hypothetical protein
MAVLQKLQRGAVFTRYRYEAGVTTEQQVHLPLSCLAASVRLNLNVPQVVLFFEPFSNPIRRRLSSSAEAQYREALCEWVQSREPTSAAPLHRHYGRLYWYPQVSSTSAADNSSHHYRFDRSQPLSALRAVDGWRSTPPTSSAGASAASTSDLDSVDSALHHIASSLSPQQIASAVVLRFVVGPASTFLQRSPNAEERWELCARTPEQAKEWVQGLNALREWCTVPAARPKLQARAVLASSPVRAGSPQPPPPLVTSGASSAPFVPPATPHPQRVAAQSALYTMSQGSAQLLHPSALYPASQPSQVHVFWGTPSHEPERAQLRSESGKYVYWSAPEPSIAVQWEEEEAKVSDEAKSHAPAREHKQGPCIVAIERVRWVRAAAVDDEQKSGNSGGSSNQCEWELALASEPPSAAVHVLRWIASSTAERDMWVLGLQYVLKQHSVAKSRASSLASTSPRVSLSPRVSPSASIASAHCADPHPALPLSAVAPTLCALSHSAHPILARLPALLPPTASKYALSTASSAAVSPRASLDVYLHHFAETGLALYHYRAPNIHTAAQLWLVRVRYVPCGATHSSIPGGAVKDPLGAWVWAYEQCVRSFDARSYSTHTPGFPPGAAAHESSPPPVWFGVSTLTAIGLGKQRPEFAPTNVLDSPLALRAPEVSALSLVSAGCGPQHQVTGCRRAASPW